MTALLACVLPAALILALIETLGVLVTLPSAREAHAAILFVACAGFFTLFVLPFVAALAVVEPWLQRLPRPPPEVLLAGGLGVVVAASATRGLHEYFERMTTEFPTAVDRVKDAGSLLLVCGAFLLAWLSLPLFRHLAQRVALFREGNAVLVLLGIVAAAIFSTFIPRTLSPIHGHPLSQLSVLIGLPLWLLVVRARVSLPTRRALLLSLVAISALLCGGLGALQHRETAFHFHSSAPVVQELDRLLRPLSDSDRDGARSVLFGGDDCAPFDAGRGPQRREIAGDGVDQDCRGGDAVAAEPDRARLPSTLWPGCAQPPTSGWSVLLITVDAVRASALAPRITPAMAKLARRSVWFTRAYAPATNTTPSFCSLFSGLPASEVVLENTAARVLLKPVGDTLPLMFQRAGYRTGMAFTFDAPEIVTQGFEERGPRHIDRRPQGKHAFSSADITRAAIDFIVDTPLAQRFFYWAHYPDAHAPYLDPSLSPTRRSKEQRYLAEVNYVDHHMGRLLNAVEGSPRGESTIVVVTSDHGEDLRDRGKEGHGPDVYERSVHVPLALYVPGCPSVLVEQPVSGKDIHATLAALLGEEAAAPTLVDAVNGEQRTLPVVSEARFQDQLRRAIVTDRYKLIVDVHGGGRLLFDLSEDPEEATSLYGVEPLTSEMESEYQRWLDRP